MKPKRIFVTNAKGNKEPFSSNKVYLSAIKAGADKALAQDITTMVESQVYPGIKTSDIFEKIKKLLYHQSPSSAIRFSIKEGMRKLGPTGYPFERYIQKIFSQNNFKTQPSQIIQGNCAKHEIDFLAYRQSKTVPGFPFNDTSYYIGECKYHHSPGARVDLEIALSFYARYLDIKSGRRNLPSGLPDFKSGRQNIKAILVTNTKFTQQAKKYASCVGIDLLGWKYPADNGLETIIEKFNLYPVTALPSLKGNLIDILINQGIILIKDLLETDLGKIKNETNITPETAEILLSEAKLIS